MAKKKKTDKAVTSPIRFCKEETKKEEVKKQEPQETQEEMQKRWDGNPNV